MNSITGARSRLRSPQYPTIRSITCRGRNGFSFLRSFWTGRRSLFRDSALGVQSALGYFQTTQPSGGPNVNQIIIYGRISLCYTITRYTSTAKRVVRTLCWIRHGRRRVSSNRLDALLPWRHRGWRRLPSEASTNVGTSSSDYPSNTRRHFGSSGGEPLGLKWTGGKPLE